MKNNKYLQYITTGVLFLLGIGFSSGQSSPITNWNKAIYSNDSIFNKLSSGARFRLEKKYGTKNTNIKKTSVKVNAFIPKSVSYSPISNILVNNPSLDTTDQDTQSETSVIKGLGNNIIAAYNDSGSYDNNLHFTGYSVSTDGGANFIDKGTLPDSADGDAGDPVLAIDTVSGRIYMTTLAFDSDQNLEVFRSDDNGLTFKPPVNSTPGFVNGTDSQDKDWITVDNAPGLGQGYVYEVWRNFSNNSGSDGITLTRSTDKGDTWIPNQGVFIASGGQGAYVVTGPNHEVYVFWYDDSGASSQISMRKSTDYGVTFGSTVNVSTLLGTGSNGDLGLEFRSDSFPEAVVNPINGNIYLVYNDDPAGTDLGDIYFTQSTTGGTTWTTPIRVNDDTTLNDQVFPAISITPNGTALSISFFDRRRDPANSLLDRYGVIGTISGNSVAFGPNFRITTQSFPVVVGVDPVINSTYMGDYDMMAADNNYFYTTWGDNRDRNLANTRYQADVRFAKIPVTGPGPILDLNSSAFYGGNNNGQIDFNECLSLNISLLNSGTQTATGIFGTLSLLSSMNGVVIVQNASPYPDLGVASTGLNLIPFQISISSTFVAGTKIDLILNATTNNAGLFSIPIQLNTGGIGATTTYSSSVQLAIPDNNLTGVYSSITVSGMNSSIAFVSVGVYITHTWDGDLELSLVGPDSTVVALSTNNGGSSNNYGSACGTPTLFVDTAATAIGSGTAPFVGQYQPEQSLSTFIGKADSAVNGVWQLHVIDDASIDTGVIRCWSLNISTVTAINGGGICGGIIPNGGFYATPTSGPGPLTVNFIDTSNNSPDTWVWDFGDDSTSNSQNPIHTYSGNTIPISYSVQLIASNSNGASTVARSNYIYVTPAPPSAGFFADTTTGFTPLLVNFTDTSLFIPTGWVWDFGDGNSTTIQNPSHLYTVTSSAYFTVQLIASNAYGSGTAVQTNYIHVTPLPPNAGFTASPVTGFGPMNVNFIDTSANIPTGWNWDFGDGANSIIQNPTHLYGAVGNVTTYSVQLIASNAYGASTVVYPNYITISSNTGPAPTLTDLPSVKLFNGQGINGIIDLLDYNTTGISATQAGIITNFLNVSNITSTFSGGTVLSGAVINYNSYGSATSGQNSYSLSNMQGLNFANNKIKWSTYRIQRLPQVAVLPGNSMDFNLISYTWDSIGNALPPSYGNASSLIVSDYSQLTAYWSNASTITISASTGFTTPVNIDVIAAPVPSGYGTDIDKERMLIYPSLATTAFEFSIGTDTATFKYQLPSGIVSLPTVSWVTAINDGVGIPSHGGALKVTFTNITSGIKITPDFPAWLTNTPGSFYTLRVRVFGTSTSNTYSQFLYNGDPGKTPTDVQGYLRYSCPTVWTDIDIPLNVFSSVSSKPVMYPQVILKATGATGSVYVDELKIFNSAPGLIGSPRHFVSDKYTAGYWGTSAATTRWAIQKLSGNPTYNVTNGQLVINFLGVTTTQTGLKFTASTSVGHTIYTIPAVKDHQVGMHMQTALTSGTTSLTLTQVQVNILGAPGPGSFNLSGDWAAAAEIGRISNRILRLGFNANTDNYQVQFIVKGIGGSTVKIDNTQADSDLDYIDYGDPALYP